MRVHTGARAPTRTHTRASAHSRSRKHRRVARDFFPLFSLPLFFLLFFMARAFNMSDLRAGWNSLCRAELSVGIATPTPFFFPPVISTLHNIAFYLARVRTSVYARICTIRNIFLGRLVRRYVCMCACAIAASRASHFSPPAEPRARWRKVNCLRIFPRAIIDSRAGSSTRISTNAESSAGRVRRINVVIDATFGTY